MAVRNDPYMFLGGAERFNSQPETLMYANLMARKQAQQDAVDNYYSKLGDNINPEGVRHIDMKDFQKMVEDYKTFSIQNRDKLRKGDMQTQLEVQKKYAALQAHITKSKDAALGDKEGLATWQKLRDEDKNPEEMFKELQYNQRPVTDPEYKRFTPTSYFNAPKTFNEQGYLSKFKDIKRDEATQLGRVDPKTGYRIDTYTKTLPADKKNQIAAQAMADYQDVWSFNDRVRDVIKNPEERKKLSDFYQQEFGRMPETNEQLAAAYVLRGINPTITEQGKPVRDEKWMLDYRNSQERQMKQWEHDLKGMDEVKKNTWLQDYLTDQSDKARKDEFGNPKPMKIYETGSGSVAGNELPLSSFMYKAFTKGSGANTLVPSKVIVSDVTVQQSDGTYKVERKYTPLYYGGDGKLLKDESVSQDLNATIVDMGGQVGVKQKNIEGAALSDKKTDTKTTGKTYKVNGYDYSEQEISDAAKQLGMSKEAYMKKYNIK